MRKKKAFVLPVILIILVVMALMAIALNLVSTHEYRFTYRSSDHLKALYIAKAVVEACIAQIKQDANKKGSLRKALIGDNGGKLNFNLSGDFKSAVDNLVNRLNQKDSDVKLGKAGFEYEYELFHSKANIVNNIDKIKTLTVKVIITYKGVGQGGKFKFKKIIWQSFDIKIADVRPVGNKYVFMIAKAGENDFNKGDHLWISNTDLDTHQHGDGISIGGNKIIIDLGSKPYFRHNDWKRASRDPKYDLNREDPNSIHSLIPGWNTLGPISPNGPKVADNEPWSNRFSSPSTIPLSMLEGASTGKSSPSFSDSGPHSKGGRGLLKTGGGTNLESMGQPCGPGIRFKQFKHPLSGNTNFYNTGLSTGKTHLFYRNCSVVCSIYGNVYKRWQVWKYTAKGVMDTGKGLPPNGGSVCTVVHGKRFYCKAHAIWPPNMYWDAMDVATLGLAGKATGKYMCKSKNQGWNRWQSSAIPIDNKLNFKSSRDFQDYNYICNKFVMGVTRFIDNLNDDNTLFDGSNLYCEGIIMVKNGGDINVNMKNPGMLISKKDFSISNIPKPSSNKNNSFAPYVRLALVSGNEIKINTSSKTYAGVCAKRISGNNIKLKGNLVAKDPNKENLSGKIVYDYTFKKLSEEDFGDGSSHNDSAYVISISPISGEFIEENNLK